MAVTQLHRLREMSSMLLEIIGEDDDLPGWIQYKISRAYNDLNDAFGYLEPKSQMGDSACALAKDPAEFSFEMIAESVFRNNIRRIIRRNIR